MKYLTLDKINCNVSKIGLGTGKFGTIVNQKTAFQMMDLFAEQGGTLFDTARNYYEWVPNGRGKSEQCIGEWLETRKSREKCCIVTKGGVRNHGSNFTVDLSKDNLMTELYQSLEALRTNYLDIYLLHRDDIRKPVEEIVETMQYLCDIANISYIGVANWDISRVIKANDYAKQYGMKQFSVIQTWWSLAEYTGAMWNDPTTTHMDLETYQYLMKEHYVGMAYTSQCKGFFQKAIKLGLDNLDEKLKKRIMTQRNLKKLDYIKDYCMKNQVNPTSVVNSYITSNPLQGIALVGCTSMEQLQEIMSGADYILKYEDIKEIDNI